MRRRRRVHGNTDGAKQKDALTGEIHRAAFEVSSALGHGFLEIMYQRTLFHEPSLAGVKADREVPFRVHYNGQKMGAYIADMVVENTVIVELKAIETTIGVPQVSQCPNYLRARGLKTALILNFGKPRLKYKRVMP